MIFLRRVTKSQLSGAMGMCFGFGIAFFLLSIDKVPAIHLSMLAFSQPQQQWFQTKALEIVPKSWSPGENIHYYNKTLILEGKGVISKLHGGIGNQLHSYACTYALARDLKRPLFNYVHKSSLYSSRKFRPAQRSFVLDKFQIPLTNLIDESTNFDKSSVSYINDSQLLFRTYPTDHTFLQVKPDSFCKSEAFWAQYKEEIISMFQLRPEVVNEFPSYVTDLAKEIETSRESVAVHVRRGDFRGSWLLPISYQRDSIVNISRMIQQRLNTNDPLKPKFFIFSDDIKYCRKKLGKLGKVHDLVFVSLSNGTTIRTTSLEDFFLMTKCKHFIIPNSTFGWWAAYLGTHKKNGNGFLGSTSDGIVIAADYRPGYWMNKKYKNKKTLNFYHNVIHGTVLFPNGWVVHRPLS